MATTQQTKSTQTANTAANTAKPNDEVQTIASALAALPKENEQTMKEFLSQQVANAKNANDELVEQFGSAIDNSEFAATMNDVKDAFRKDAERKEKDENTAKQQEFLTNIQTDLERILENQGDALRADVTRDDAVNDSSLSEIERKDEEKVDEETDVVKEDVKPVEVKVDVQLPQPEQDDVSDNSENVTSKTEDMLSNLVSEQAEQNVMLADISKKLPDVDDGKNAVDEDKTTEPSNTEKLLKTLVDAQAEQNLMMTDIGKKLPDVDDGKDVTAEEKQTTEPSKAETSLTDLVAAQTEQTAVLTDISEKLSVEDDIDTNNDDTSKDVPNEAEVRVSEVNDNLGKIKDTLDDIVEQFGESIANTDVNEPAPINVHVDVETKQPEADKVDEETPSTPQSVELGEGSLDSLRELAETVKQNETDLIEQMKDKALTSNGDSEQQKKASITELANDISGASDSMNNQEETPLKSREDERIDAKETEQIERDADKSSRYDEDVNQVATMEEQPPVLDTRMDMAARAERDITPVLNDVQMFNRMSLTKEEIHVLASEIGKAVAENMVDREGDRKRDAAYLEEVERIVRG